MINWSQKEVELKVISNATEKLGQKMDITYIIGSKLALLGKNGQIVEQRKIKYHT